MNYKVMYNNICTKNKNRKLIKEDGYEIHHILPRCMGGTDQENNLVKLTYREHFIAHKLLTKFTEDEYRYKLEWAVTMMVRGSSNPYARVYCKRKEFINRAYYLYYAYKPPLGEYVQINFKDYTQLGEKPEKPTTQGRALLRELNYPYTINKTNVRCFVNFTMIMNACIDDGKQGIVYSKRAAVTTDLCKRFLKMLEDNGFIHIEDMGGGLQNLITFKKRIPVDVRCSTKIYMFKRRSNMPRVSSFINEMPKLFNVEG